MKFSFGIYLYIFLFSFVTVSCKEEKYIDQPGRLVPRTADQDPAIPSISVKWRFTACPEPSVRRTVL